MKTLKELNPKPTYWSDVDDLLQDFYIPALSASIRYCRIAGFFSSNTLAIAARGLAPFIANHGEMFLITSIILSQDDKESIEEALKSTEDKILKDISELEDKLKTNHVKMLCWMVKNNKLKIKVALIKEGILHQKIGILHDKNGDILSFSGSENETAHGWLYNDETFHVFTSWKEGDVEHLNGDLRQFQQLWDGKTKKSKIYPISEAFENKLIKLAPKDSKEFEKLSLSIIEGLSKKKKTTKKQVRDYQQQAIDAWENNGFKGIFEMATGTGKTFTSLNALKALEKHYSRMVVVIVVPYQHLVPQWRKEFCEFFGYEYKLLEAHGYAKDWKKKVNEYLQEYALNTIDKLVIFSIYDTFSEKTFYSLVEKYLNNGSNLALIADEVHFLGAPGFSHGMRSIYKFRLALSATPERWFDKEGSEGIREYFSKTIFRFGLKEAIPKYLVPYDYYPQLVYMNDEEFQKYTILAERISRVSSFAKKDESDRTNKYLLKLLIDRANIVVNNIDKKKRFEDIIIMLKSKDMVKHLLVYCSPQQIKWASEILDKHNIIYNKFTFEEALDKREKLLLYFAQGKYKALIAMKCLDQGLDIPSIRCAIILASSTNPMQYIQRRGRVLRKFPGKEKATIYDFVVIPSETAILTKNVLSIEQKIFKRELTRAREFYETASNKDEVLLALADLMNKYQVYFGGENETGDK